MRRAVAGTTVWEKGFHLCVKQSEARLNALTLITVLTPQTSGLSIGTTQEKPFINRTSVSDALAVVVAAGETLLTPPGFYLRTFVKSFEEMARIAKTYRAM